MSCNKCTCTCPLEPGDRIRYKKTFEDLGHADVRLGEAEPKFLTYISKAWVGFSVYNAKDNFLKEEMIPRALFDSTLERDTEQ